MTDEIGAEKSKPAINAREEFPLISFFTKLHHRFFQRYSDNKSEEHQTTSSRMFSTATWVIAFFAIVIVCISIFQYNISNKQLTAMQNQLEAMNIAGEQTDEIVRAMADEAKSAKISATMAQQMLIANQRAWVGPSDVYLSSPLEKNKSFNILIRYMNTGREPAFDLLTFHGNWISSATEWDNGVAAQKINALKDKCLATLPSIAGTHVAYPTTGTNTYNLAVNSGEQSENKDIVFTDRLSNGDDVFIIQGCFVYRSVNSIHHSAFCHFYQAKVTRPPALSICTVGNAAD